MPKRLRNMVSPPAVEQRAALLAGKHITYTLKRSDKRRSIGLRIDDRGLTVSVPLRASEKWLSSVLQDKARWVVEKLDGWQVNARRKRAGPMAKRSPIWAGCLACAWRKACLPLPPRSGSTSCGCLSQMTASRHTSKKRCRAGTSMRPGDYLQSAWRIMRRC